MPAPHLAKASPSSTCEARHVSSDVTSLSALDEFVILSARFVRSEGSQTLRLVSQERIPAIPAQILLQPFCIQLRAVNHIPRIFNRATL
jgi:hypothetical protein